MLQRIKKLFKDEEGATMVEYALMLALIAVVCILIVGKLGTKSATAFDQTQVNMGDPAPTLPT